MLHILPTMLRGALVTVEVTTGAVIVACASASCAVAMRLSGLGTLEWPARVYIELFRGTSALIQLFWVFYALPLILPFRPTPMAAAIAVLGLNGGAYGAEILRGAILAVPKEQHDASAALNLSPTTRMFRVILPQSLPLIIPPLANLFIDMLKNSALAGLVQVTDLTFQSQILQESTLQNAKIYGLALIMYFVMALVLAGLMRLLERIFKFPIGARV
jgi:polar amino acid transport system permease protein